MLLEGTKWGQILNEEMNKDYFKLLQDKVAYAYANTRVFPPRERIYKALYETDYDQVKVVILGQDPYHGQGQAMGLSFSVPDGTKVPPSLKNIYKEMAEDLGTIIQESGDLTYLARQGVLLLNAVLTVEEGQPASHKSFGWDVFTDAIIDSLNQREGPVIFVLWGNFAATKASRITNSQHRVLVSAHPSPLSARRGFFGSKPFSTINQWLVELGQTPIQWVKATGQMHFDL